MKYKFLLIPALVFGLFTVRPAFSFVQDCSEEACAIPSSSQFFLDDANDIPFIDDELSPIPTSGQFWPVDGIITGHYGKWRGGRHRGHVHAGVDIAAAIGTPILAPISGMVAFVGRKGGYGNTLIVDHGNGIATLYAHTSEILVSEGDEIKKGQLIAKVGNSGRSSGPHLHYEVRMEGAPVNPLAWTEKLQTKKSL